MDFLFIQSKGKDVKDNKLERFSSRQARGDYFPSYTESKGLLSSPIEKKGIYILFFIIMIVAAIIGMRITWLQVVYGQKYRDLSEGNRIRIVRIPADRGLIYDRNLIPLVKNIAYFSLAITPGDLPKDEQEREQILNNLSILLEKTSLHREMLDSQISSGEDEKENSADFLEILKSASPYSYQPIKIIENIDYTRAMSLLLKLDKLPGITLIVSARRKYNDAEIFSHILGYVGKINPEEYKAHPYYALNDFIGKIGLELHYEKILRGEFGKKRIEVNSLGKEERVESIEMPQSGYDLILSIDGELQKKIINTLEKYLKRAGSKAGAAVALNPQTGEVLAITSYPFYDNNIFIKGDKDAYQSLADSPNKPFVFRAISGEYPSGSVIKPVIAAGALSEGIINENTIVNSYGGIAVGKWFFSDWKEGGHGSTNVIKALAESVNTFFYYIGGGFKNFQGLGIDNINKYARLFGLTKATGIDLPSERNGFLATPQWKKEVKKEQWYIGDTYHIAIGQGDILVTPIQVAVYTAAIANGGTLLRPHVVKYIQNPQTREVQKDYEKNIINSQVVGSEYIDIVKKGMRQAVTKGSAIRLFYLPVEVAGKTGTAQVGGDKKPHAWFTGFAPYEDPEIVITVVIENAGEGSAVAVPAVYEILEWWIKNRSKIS